MLKLLSRCDTLLHKNFEVLELNQGLAMLVNTPISCVNFNFGKIEPQMELQSALCDGRGVARGPLRMILSHDVVEARREDLCVRPTSLVFLHY